MGSILMERKILVTGCSGLVGIEVCMTLAHNRNIHVIGVDIKRNKYLPNGFDNFTYYNLDLTDKKAVDSLFEQYPDLDGVINCFGIKGSPIRAKEKPLDFLEPSIKGNINIIENCYKHDTFLVFLSSVGVYEPAEEFVEDTVWKTLPSPHDWFPSWSKRIPELYLDAYKVQHNWEGYCILRPANIFGVNDNFGEGSTVIAATIKKVYDSNEGDDIIVWGDGKSTRDFVDSRVVSDICIKCLEDKRYLISNIGSGVDISIEEMVKTVIDVSEKDLKIVYDTSKPNGDRKRRMSVKNQKELSLYHHIPFKEAVCESYLTYKERQDEKNR